MSSLPARFYNLRFVLLIGLFLTTSVNSEEGSPSLWPDETTPYVWTAQAQAKLLIEGFNLNVDGRLGPKTVEALLSFQSSSGLKVTGELDSDTRTKLDIRPCIWWDEVLSCISDCKPMSMVFTENGVSGYQVQCTNNETEIIEVDYTVRNLVRKALELHPEL